MPEAQSASRYIIFAFSYKKKDLRISLVASRISKIQLQIIKTGLLLLLFKKFVVINIILKKKCCFQLPKLEKNLVFISSKIVKMLPPAFKIYRMMFLALKINKVLLLVSQITRYNPFVFIDLKINKK